MFIPEPMSPASPVPVFGAMLALSAVGVTDLTAAQERQVVSNRVTVSDSDATLSLEFDSGAAIEISFQDGEIRVNGEGIGGYAANGELETSWRSLLSEVIPLDDGPLSDALRAWQPEGQLDDDARAVAARLEQTLEEVLATPVADDGAAFRSALGAREGGATAGMDPVRLRLLLQRGPELEEALEGVDLTTLSLHVGENVTVDRGNEVEGALVVVEGDASVSGEVSGDVVVVRGELRIDGDAYIRGDVRVVDGRLQREGGTVEGAVRTLGTPDAEETGEQADVEVPAVARSVPARQADVSFRPLRYIMSGLGGLFRDVFWLAIVLAVGFVVVHFAGERLQNVADAARAFPGRAALVGLAGGFLLLPVWVLGGLALLVSIIGIPLLIAWLPIFPLAVVMAHGLGYLAVATVVGEWLSRKGIPALDRFRPSNQVHVLGVGLAALVLPSAFSHVAEMGGPSLGSFLSGLFTFLAFATAMVALTIGFGAVLLTGAGRTSDVAAMAASYGGRIRATRAWTRRRSRRSAHKNHGRGVGDPSGPAEPELETEGDAGD